MKKYLPLIALALILVSCKQEASNESSTSEKQPNILLIFTDDQGWNDVGFNENSDIKTPHLDGIAESGVIFSQGYISHPYCSPSRAGLLTGRYQQHFGHESNPGYDEYEDEVPDGMPLDQLTIADVLKENGYTTGAIGKWHLGDDSVFWPTERGFDHWYGFSGGGRSFWPAKTNKHQHQLRRNGHAVPDDFVYITDAFTEDAIDFIQDNKKNPFFLYLAYNAPHAPIHATGEYLDKTEYIEEGGRSAYAAMCVGIDEGVGKIKKVLEDENLLENTIIFYVSDNGGHTLGASCDPYRGHKGMLFEGGIRVPFMMSWPAKIEGGKIFEEAVISLDIFPTILGAANITDVDLPLDGKNLLPHLQGEEKQVHETLFWRYSGGKGYAVRNGKYKLVHEHSKGKYLFDMENDEEETVNLIDELPEVTKELEALYAGWNEQNMVPLWDDPHIPNVEKEYKRWKTARDKARWGEKRQM